MAAMKVHFVIHESFEAPGAYLSWIKSRGHIASYSRVYEGDALPADIDPIDLLVVMGGPQSPTTTREECLHFDGRAECALISGCVEGGKAVVGVCLGAQLIGTALGAAHMRSPEPEIGSFPIRLTAHGVANAKFAGFGKSLVVGHWHNDMPGLTDDARILAVSDGCPRQIIEYGELVYGFQCHMEFTASVIEGLIAASASDLAALRDRTFVQQAHALRTNKFDEMNEILFSFLDQLMAAYAHKQGQRLAS